MLPHIQLQNGDQCNGDVALLIVELLDNEALADGVPREDCPAGALDAQCNAGEVLAELVEGAEELVDCCCQLASGLVATLGGQVVPEDGVVGVATQVECQVLGELGDVAVCTVLACLFKLLESCVSACNVCCVVLIVVQLHDLCGDVGLERRVVVGELGEGVLFSHDDAFH